MAFSARSILGICLARRRGMAWPTFCARMETRRWLFSLLLCQPMRKYISTLDRSPGIEAAPVMIMRLSDDGESCLVYA